MTRVDWVALAFVLLTALVGLRRGLLAGAFSAAGVIVGAIVGARLAPQLLSGGSRSPYTPLVALAGAAVLAMLLSSLGGVTGSWFRGGLRFQPLRALDSAGGLVLGGAAGLAIVWVLGAVALQLPGQVELRRGAQRSLVLRELNEIVPPSRLLKALARFDPFPSIAGPLAPIEPPDPALPRQSAVQRAGASVVRVLGTACGLGVVGSGWVARPGIVVTAAHVVAGQTDTVVEARGSDRRLSAEPVAFDVRNDLALLRVTGLRARPLPVVEAEPGTAVAILGYPGNRSLTATPGRIGRTTSVLTQDAYGSSRVLRTITAVGGRIRSGNSGGPAVDALGRVQTTVFASRVGTQGGYGVPTDVVRKRLSSAREPVSTGDCAR